MSHFNYSYCLPKIVKRVASRIIFRAHARNVRLQHERKRVDADAVRLANSTFNNSVIQSYPLVVDASF